MTRLILDALFPPAPAQLVADLNAVGADGAAVYVWRPGGVGTWTPDHVTALRASNKLAFPIIVPLPEGGDINGMLGAAKAFGFTGGPITIDAEPPNLPPASWEETFDRAAVSNGFSDFDYGTPSDLGRYQPDDQNWVATWLRTGILNPLPELPTGQAGWQFVNDIVINGHTYDASVIDDSVFGGEEFDVTTSAQIDSLYQELMPAPPNGPGIPGNVTDTLVNGNSAWQQSVDQKLDALGQPAVPADFAAQVAKELAGDQTFLDAIATAVAHKLGSILGAG